MTIGSITTSTASIGVTQRHAHPAPPSLDSTAERLGMSTDELASAMRSGTTLVDLAAQKGVGKDDLVKSIAADLKANAPADAPPVDDARLTQMATSIAEGKRPGLHHHRPGDESGDQSRETSTLATIASTLGMEDSDLLTALESGTSLPDLASQHGTTMQAILDALTAAAGDGRGIAIDAKA